MFGFGGGGGGGFGRRTFADSFRCHSVSLLAAEQQRDVNQLEFSDKIILPPSCLEKLAQLEIDYPMMFEIANPRNVASRMHCGVLEFIAQEGMIYLPYWMMENMHLNEGDIVHLKSASIQKGSFVKLQVARVGHLEDHRVGDLEMRQLLQARRRQDDLVRVLELVGVALLLGREQRDRMDPKGVREAAPAEAAPASTEGEHDSDLPRARRGGARRGGGPARSRERVAVAARGPRPVGPMRERAARDGRTRRWADF